MLPQAVSWRQRVNDLVMQSPPRFDLSYAKLTYLLPYARYTRPFKLERLCDERFMLYTSSICTRFQSVGVSRCVDICLNASILVIRKPDESAWSVRSRGR
jgi:hypothetical protein